MHNIERLTQKARRLAAILGDTAIHDRASAAAAAAQSSFESELAAASIGHVDCRKGCAHCCYVHVSATAPEIFPVARTLAESSDVAALSRLEQLAQTVVGLDAKQRLVRSVPCPLLSGDLCSVYAIRPLNCRSMASRSESQCFRTLVEHHDEGVPIPSKYVRLGDGQAIALRAAIRSLGLSDDRYELSAALATVLSDSDSEQRWLAGEDIFEGLPEVNVVRSSELDATVATVVEAIQQATVTPTLSYRWQQ